MTKGILVFAHNNAEIDYVKQAAFLADRAKQYLNLPVSIVTDKESIGDRYKDWFDKIIINEIPTASTKKQYYNGAKMHSVLEFKNDNRCLAYDLSPYDETLMLDSDYVIADDVFKNCFTSIYDFLLYKDAIDIAGNRDTGEFFTISETSVDFYWATCVFFRKTEINKRFFDLIKHIQEYYTHYRKVYNIQSTTYRNDFAFSIAIHIMNGFKQGDFAKKMPGKLFFTADRDILHSLKGDKFIFLLQCKDSLDNFSPCQIQGNSVHVMNKYTLEDNLSA